MTMNAHREMETAPCVHGGSAFGRAVGSEPARPAENSRGRAYLPLLLLLLATLACNFSLPLSSDNGSGNGGETAPEGGGAQASEDELVRRAVATVQAQLPASTGPAASPGSTTVDAELEASLITLYDQINPSVVYVLTSFSGTEIGSGSGFVYDDAGHIVTNHHVVDNGDSFEVIFSDGSHQAASLVGKDADSDLAVLQVEQRPPAAKPVPLADFEEVRVGQFVVAIGNPFGEQGSISLGIVSGLGRRIRSQRDTPGGTFSLPGVIQTDAPINPGNSGGPLLNLHGEIIGVNSAIRTETGFNSGVGFAIPVRAVRRIIPALIDEGKYSYPYVGVHTLPVDLDLNLQEALELPQPVGVYVTGVTPGGPADEAGLIPAASGGGPMGAGPGGDLIIAIDEREVKDFQDLIGYLVFETVVGQTVQLTVLRDGESVTLPLTLSERP